MKRLWKSERRRSLVNTYQIQSQGCREKDAYVDKFLLAFVFGSPSLIPEYHIVIPPTDSVRDLELEQHDKQHADLRLVTVSFVGMRRGLPRAISFSRCACSSVAFSRSWD